MPANRIVLSSWRMTTDAPETKQLPSQRRTARLGGRQKAAILFVTLGREPAAEVFGHLKEDEIEALSPRAHDAFEKHLGRSSSDPRRGSSVKGLGMASPGLAIPSTPPEETPAPGSGTGQATVPGDGALGCAQTSA